jgi:hypothetical protein
MSVLCIYDYDDCLVNTRQVLKQNGWFNPKNISKLIIDKDPFGKKVSDLTYPLPTMAKAIKSSSTGCNVILSGRCASQILYWLRKHKYECYFHTVIGLALWGDISEYKKNIIKRYLDRYDEIFFYDDKIENIEAADTLEKVTTIHVH